jgi:hypothetical protein
MGLNNNNNNNKHAYAGGLNSLTHLRAQLGLFRSALYYSITVQ